jgi:hypothetical protein
LGPHVCDTGSSLARRGGVIPRAGGVGARPRDRAVSSVLGRVRQGLWRLGSRQRGQGGRRVCADARGARRFSRDRRQTLGAALARSSRRGLSSGRPGSRKSCRPCAKRLP